MAPASPAAFDRARATLADYSRSRRRRHSAGPYNELHAIIDRDLWRPRHLARRLSRTIARRPGAEERKSRARPHIRGPVPPRNHAAPAARALVTGLARAANPSARVRIGDAEQKKEGGRLLLRPPANSTRSLWTQRRQSELFVAAKKFSSHAMQRKKKPLFHVQKTRLEGRRTPRRFMFAREVPT